MCGIVGYIAKTKKLLKDERQHFLRYALIMDTLRGQDSTGVMAVYPGFKVIAHKAATPGYKFIAHPEYDKIKKDGWCTIGHNRAATAGNVSRDNAHPFLFGNVSLVHNGTLVHRGTSLDTFDSTLPVDSMQIANALNIAQPEEADEILEQIDGSFTLAWFDNRDQSVNLARNRERPMHFCVNKDRTFMMFMSDGDMLTALNKSFPHNNEARGQCVYSLDSYRHLKFHYGDLVPEVTRFRPFSRPVVVHTPPPKGSSSPSGKSTTGQSRIVTNGGSRTSSIDLPPHKTKSADGGSLLIPKAHTEALWDKYEMKPDMRLRFTPSVAMQVSDYLMRVYGELYYPEWYSDWPAVINWVPLVQWNAYYKNDWLVRPIGVSSPNEFIGAMEHMPAVMCELLKPNFHFHPHSPDWFLLDPEKMAKDEKVQKTLDRLLEEEEEEDDPEEQLVQGPQGIPLKRKKLRKLLDDGCMRCTGPLIEDDAADYGYVNNGNGVVCENCKWAMEGEE